MSDYSDLLTKRRLHNRWFWKRFCSDLLHYNTDIKNRYASFFEKYFPRDKSSHITLLDIGSGSGFYLSILSKHVKRIIALDIVYGLCKTSKQTLENNNIKNAHITNGSMSRLPFRDESFDAILFMESLHHSKNHDIVINESKRVLKKGGHIVLLEPNGLNPVNFIVGVFSMREREVLRIKPSSLRNLFADFEYVDLFYTNYVFCSGMFIKIIAKSLNIFLSIFNLNKYSVRLIVVAKKC